MSATEVGRETTPPYSMDGDLYVDRLGNRYTTCPAASQTDPWWGATILMPGSHVALGEAGLLPLTEVVRPRWADQPKPRRRWRHR